MLREGDTPVVGASVFGSWRGGRGSAKTDVHGRFAIANFSQGMVSFVVNGPGIEELRQQGIDSRAGEVELRVRSVPTRS